MVDYTEWLNAAQERLERKYKISVNKALDVTTYVDIPVSKLGCFRRYGCVFSEYMFVKNIDSPTKYDFWCPV